MGKQEWKPGNMLYPVPAVMLSCQREGEKPNIITVAWAGTICSDPVMLSVSIRKERHSHGIISETGEFVVNLTTEELCYATDYCGVKSGRDVDKFMEMHLTAEKASKVKVPLIGESPVNLECKVVDVKELGSHDMFIAQVVAVHVDEKYLDDKGRLDLGKANLITYSHGEYFGLGKKLGKFGYSVEKKNK
ncbi:MAG: flavin reductase family protein [Lachnospira sp.]